MKRHQTTTSKPPKEAAQKEKASERARQSRKSPGQFKTLFLGGILNSANHRMRWTLFGALVIASAAFSFTQLGFISIPLPDGNTAYVVTMLPLVAIAALLLGAPLGTALGLIAGGVMLLHAQYLPLDHFELLFVTPTSSAAMLAVAGFVFGLLFAFALRNNPSQPKRIIYIAIISIFVTLTYTFFFLVNAMISLIVEMQLQLGNDLDEAYAQELGTTLALRMGDVGAQTLITIVLLTLICSVNDYVARKAIQRRGTMHLRSVFAARLGVVCSLAFLAMAAASFCVSTDDELRDAEDDMSSKAAYISNQVKASNGRIGSLQNIFIDSKIDIDSVSLEDVYQTVASDTLLTGYESNADGIILVMFDDTLLELTNDPQIESAAGSSLRFSLDMSTAIEDCLDSRRMQRFVYDENSVRSEESKTQIEESINPQIM